MSLTNESGSGMVMPVGPMNGGYDNGMFDSLYMALDQASSDEERRSIKQLIEKYDC